MDRIVAALAVFAVLQQSADASLADRSRIVKARQGKNRYLDNGRPIEGPAYRSRRHDIEQNLEAREIGEEKKKKKKNDRKASWKMNIPTEEEVKRDVVMLKETPEEFERKLSSQLTGCCYTYQSYAAADLCAMYGQDCESGETPSHDSSDGDCSVDGLSFIGISFSVNTPNGNPYSYQLCDQFPMENIIDRNYDYVMSMDEDGWLVGGGYKTFDYSGKMPYIDSSHTEVIRIGNLDPDNG
jgi:hypothetical protein